jgi:hypothetical protein
MKNNRMILRMVSVREGTANEGTKSVQVVVASENPVERYDEERDLVIREILLMDGMKFRTEKKQLPIVDSHDRSTVRNVLGSVRNLRVEDGQLVGDAMFAADEDSQRAFQKLKDGHLTDFSITATPKNVLSIRRGETYNLRGKWIPSDASLVAAGADETSTVRQLKRAYFFGKGSDMGQKIERAIAEELKANLVGKGMPEQIEDAEEALTWLMGMMSEGAEDESAVAPPIEQAEEMTDDPMMPPEEEVQKAMDEEIKKAMGESDPKKEEVKNCREEMTDDSEQIQKKLSRMLAYDQKRRNEIVALCKASGVERAYADKLCNKRVPLKIARKLILEKIMRSKPIGSTSGHERIEVTRSGDDKFNAAIRDGLLQRAFRGAGLKASPFADGRPASGSDEFKHFGLKRMAEKILQRAGVNTDRMSDRDIALVAMGSPSSCNRFNIERSYHTTGMFANLLLDAANKTLLAAYEEANTTYQAWVRTAPAVADFKAINRIRFSEAPDLEVVPEARPYKEGVMTDQRETYKVEKYGAMFSVTWETVVNDDLDAISRIPAMHGNAAKRKVNKVCYNVLTSNPTMSDTFGLFSASHASGSNFSNASAAPAVATLNTAYAAMMVQKGMNSDTILAITPKHLIVPAALSATAAQLITSTADPLAGGNTAGNANTNNIYGPSGVRALNLIVEPLLDAYSTTAWFLASDYASVDTVEVSFLQGEESPVLENEWDFNTDCYKYKIRQTFGVAPIDWRGLYKYHNA